MNPSTDSIYAGIAGIQLGSETIDLGSGLALKPTYAHLMAPFLMAFSRAEPGASHPAPWAAVKGGLAIDIHLELFVPASFSPSDPLDRLNTVWWITSLLRLALSPRIHAPVISDRPFTDVPKDWQGAKLFPVEAFSHKYHGELYKPVNSEESLRWVVRTWHSAQALMRVTRFSDAYRAFDAIWTVPSPSLALLTLWGALENLFSPAKQELRFRVSANIASFLEPPGPARLALHKHLLKLYDARSTAAHTAGADVKQSLEESQKVTRRVLYKIFELGRVPSKDDLDTELFGAGT